MERDCSRMPWYLDMRTSTSSPIFLDLQSEVFMVARLSTSRNEDLVRGWLSNTRKNARCMRITSRPHLLVPQSRSQMPRSFWSATGIATSGLILWPVPTPEVRDSRTSRHSAHAHSHVWQISLVLVPIYCVYKSIQDRNVVGPGQGSRFFKRMTKGTPGTRLIVPMLARFVALLSTSLPFTLD